MKINSIQFKLPAIIALSFVIVTAVVLFIVEQNVTAVINLSQESEYQERLQSVLGTIESHHQRLQRTAMVEAYQDDFQSLALRQLQRRYSQASSRQITPFIVDAAGQLLLEPIWPNGEGGSYSKALFSRIEVTKEGSFTFSLPGDGAVWCVFRTFIPWGWTAGYLVPLDEKYRMANQLNQTLLLLFGSGTVLVVILLTWYVRGQLRPITELTAAAVEISQGKLERRINTGRNDEIGTLAASFNQMQLAIQQKIDSLRRSEERLSLDLIGANSGLWDWDLKTGAIFFDENYFRIAGYEPDEFPHAYEQWQQRVHPDDIDAAEAGIDDYVSGRTEQFSVEFRFKTKPGPWMWILGQGIISERDSSGSAVRFTGTHTDISERKRVEDALRRSEDNLKTTLNSIGDAVISTDADMRIAQMNPIAAGLTGWDAAAALGKPFADVFRIVENPSRKPLLCPAAKIMTEGVNIDLADNSLLIAKDGVEHQIAYSGAPIRKADNELVGVVLVFRDVAKEKALQAQLQQSQKMDTIGQLAGGVAHDFNNMLGGIIGASELLKRRIPEDPATSKFLGIIMQSAERAADLTSNLLAFARKQHVSSTPVDVHLALRNAVALFESTVDRRIAIKLNLAAPASMVVGDSSQLQNVFLNLCINAAQAMSAGGELSIMTQLQELDELYCATSSFDLQPGTYLGIDVADSGCGIPAEDLVRIFEPFYTTKASGQGTGLGLAAVLGTVQMHHGEITANSELGAGSVFSVLLPLSEAQPRGVEPNQQALSGTGLILIVDDEEVMRATAAAILKDLGYRVMLAENGRTGLEVFREHHHEIDLVLLDMIMPEMNGRDCFIAMKDIDPQARIVLSSGFTHSEDLLDLRRAGLAGFIRKPYLSAVLSRSVASALCLDQNVSGTDVSVD